MKVLSIGSDRKLFEEGSAVSKRIKEYGALVDELHIINMVDASEGFKEKQLSPNVWVYPTNSYINYLRPRDAVKMGKQILSTKSFAKGQTLITADAIESAWAGLRLKRIFGFPLEMQVHTEIFSPYFRGFQNRVRKSYAKKILKEVDEVRVVSQALKMEIEQLTVASVNVLPIYVEKDKVTNAQPEFDLHSQFGWHFVLLTVARLAPEKNITMMLEVLAKVRETYPSTGLVIVGSGPEEPSLRSRVKGLNLEGSVAFVGWQDNLASFYKTADIYIQTSFYEGYGLSLVEAGLSGLPVITTPVGIAAELTHTQEALIFPVYAPKLFVEGIINLLEKPMSRENLKVNMRRALDKKLLSKNDYLDKLKANWEQVSRQIR